MKKIFQCSLLYLISLMTLTAQSALMNFKDQSEVDFFCRSQFHTRTQECLNLMAKNTYETSALRLLELYTNEDTKLFVLQKLKNRQISTAFYDLIESFSSETFFREAVEAVSQMREMHEDLALSVAKNIVETSKDQNQRLQKLKDWNK